VRQLLSVRLVAALVALGLLALGVNAVFADDEELVEVVAEELAPTERRVDLIELVQSFERSPDFEIGVDGRSTGFMDVVLGPERILRIAPGTPGEITCTNLRNENRCVVFADLLGEAVLWFAVLPRGPRDTVVLPPIVDLVDGYALFTNGWLIPYPPVITRQCPESADVTSFSDFLRRFGPNSTSIVDLETRQVTDVVCGDEVT
jgi:hypothetical protein